MRLLFTALWLLLRAGAQDNQQNEVSEFAAKPDETLLFSAHGIGDEIYVCAAGKDGDSWKLNGPKAQLMDRNGKIVGRHFNGPTWEASDGSRVEGKVVFSKSGPDQNSIPWLVMEATTHEGNGIMSKVASVRRVNTKGGKAPSTGCNSAHAGTEMRVAYEADYLFYGKK